MAALYYTDAFVDLNRYATDQLKRHEYGVEVFATYQKEWDDGFGARGWKLNVAINDPDIIASTRQTGERINTSVFVHDILDHLLSGFSSSGHRSEAMALVQLARRTGVDPAPDFRQMINEDLIRGRVNGETLGTFLPPDLLAMLPSAESLSDKSVMSSLIDIMGQDALVESLVNHFFKLGNKGNGHAIRSWSKLGLAYENAANTGMALQSLLEKADDEAESAGIERLDASIIISKNDCVFIAAAGRSGYPRTVYHTEITP
ncbi:MAG: hypothetical protein KJP10_06495 [Gammaproteobacteria bacterium]|nr:hypothetical protein [Gammaproteobacteria bacterium]